MRHSMNEYRSNKLWNREDLQDLWNRKDVFETLQACYEDRIEAGFDWIMVHEKIEAQARDNPEDCRNTYEVEKYEEAPVHCVFVGTVFSLTPSGKLHMLWSHGHVTAKEVLKDEVWWEALDTVLGRHGLFPQSGEGDLCDILFCKEVEEVTQDAV